MKLSLAVAIFAALALSGCDPHSGRCAFTTPGYPLCGI